MPRSDVAIVGAGPAGAAAAWRLARSGARVTLFDASHPREKPCGGGLTGRALGLVAEMLGGPPPDGVAIRSLRFGSGQAGEGRTASVPLAGEASLVVVSRRAFDHALLEAAVAAGARLVRARVVDISTGPSGVLVTTRSDSGRFAALLGADGATSLVRRRVVGAFTRRQLSLATGYFVHGASSDEIVIRSHGRPPGYLWSFPRRDHLAVGVCAPADRVRTAEDLRPCVRAWLAHALPGRERGLRPYSWPIPSLGVSDFSQLQVAGDRWMLAGDAAGLVDPLTREGLYYALASGLHAATALLEDESPGRCYAMHVHDEIRPELSRAAALQAAFFSSGFSDLLVQALARSVRVREIMADLVAGRQAYASLRRRLAATLEVGLALRLLQLHVRGIVGPRAPRRAV